jgi:hypothetical protein
MYVNMRVRENMEHDYNSRPEKTKERQKRKRE